MYTVTSVGSANRVAVGVGHVLYRRVFPAVNFRGATRLGRAPWARNREAVVDVGSATLTLPALDFYWARYFYASVEYEPEVAHALRLLGAVRPALLLDCGANYGLWSVRAAAGEFGAHQVVAVEASRSTFEYLARNVSEYRGRALWSAISDKVGEVSFDDSAVHEARHITESGGNRVPATTIDALSGDASAVMIKLDVEGAEAAALAGATATLQRADVVFLYEDHGADFECLATRAVQKAGLVTYFLSDDGKVSRVHTLEDVRRHRPSKTVGYNFAAVTPRGAYDARLAAAVGD
jgi:FkbM family methyltransferase